MTRYETIIREIIDYRLKVGGGECHIGVHSVAKTAMRDLGFKDSMRLVMYKTVVEVIEQYDSKLWGLSSRTHHVDIALAPLRLRIYQVSKQKSDGQR